MKLLFVQGTGNQGQRQSARFLPWVTKASCPKDPNHGLEFQGSILHGASRTRAFGVSGAQPPNPKGFQGTWRTWASISFKGRPWPFGSLTLGCLSFNACVLNLFGVVSLCFVRHSASLQATKWLGAGLAGLLFLVDVGFGSQNPEILASFVVGFQALNHTKQKCFQCFPTTTMLSSLSRAKWETP